MNNLSTHIILVAIMLVTVIINLAIMNAYRKNSLKIYKQITTSDKISQDNILSVEKTGKKTQEKFYNLEKMTSELIERIEKTMKNDEDYQLYLIKKYKREYNNNKMAKFNECKQHMSKISINQMNDGKINLDLTKENTKEL